LELLRGIPHTTWFTDIGANMGVVANAIDRTAGTEREYSLGMDPTVFMFDRKLRTEYTSPIEPFMVDKPDGGVRTLMDRLCTHRKFEDAIF